MRSATVVVRRRACDNEGLFVVCLDRGAAKAATDSAVGFVSAETNTASLTPVRVVGENNKRSAMAVAKDKRETTSESEQAVEIQSFNNCATFKRHA